MKGNKITEALELAKRQGRKAFVPFNVLGYPDKDTCKRSLIALARAGATALEIGLPFSDPIADGPVIQEASHKVLDTGFTFSDALKIIRDVRDECPDIALNVLTYYNLALSKGPKEFFAALKVAGVDGLTFVDLPVEEIDEIYEVLLECELVPIMLISPLTPEPRIKKILNYAQGFVYLVSRAGITGMHESYQKNLAQKIEFIKQEKEIAVLVGFGISNPQQAKKMTSLGADGVIVGSKIVDLISKVEASEISTTLESYTKELLDGINDQSLLTTAADHI